MFLQDPILSPLFLQFDCPDYVSFLFHGSFKVFLKSRAPRLSTLQNLRGFRCPFHHLRILIILLEFHCQYPSSCSVDLQFQSYGSLICSGFHYYYWICFFLFEFTLFHILNLLIVTSNL
jgi:hypothetical protein